MPSLKDIHGSDLHAMTLAFLRSKYTVCSDARQKSMGLEYVTAETSDLAAEMVRFFSEIPPSRFR